MDSFFNIGAPELILILIIAGMVMGPQRIRDVARWLGKTTAQLQEIARGFTSQLNRELDQLDDGGELKSALKDVDDLRQEVARLRREVSDGLKAPLREATQAVRETQTAVENSIHPPSIDPNGALPSIKPVADDPD